MDTARLRRLRYPAVCWVCGRVLEPRTKAWWDSAASTATCVGCAAERPADPFEVIEPELEGEAGGSAQMEADRRTGRADKAAWMKGAAGERRLSAILRTASSEGRFIVLDDRRIPGSRANIDHIVVARSGVYVIDAKAYRGRVERRSVGFWKWRTERLFVNGRNRTNLATGMGRQTDAVRVTLDASGAGSGIPVIAVLCFTGSEWGFLDPAFNIGRVRVLWPKALTKLLSRPGSFDGATRTKCARLMSVQLEPAVRQRPTKVS